MNKSAIQKYAIWARKELIEQVKQRAFQYGISETGFGDENASIVAARVLSNDEKRQRKQFIEVIKRSTYQQTIEEVAYTWFNRFIALRYMEVNDYLPTHVRVFSDTSGSFKPEILSSVLHIELPGLDKSKVSEYINSNQTQELYRYILLTQCNALNELLPEMFERLGAYTEMLLPNNILKPEGVIGCLVNDIPEDDFKDAVQIIGWMYQYYNTEPKQEVFDGFKKNIKITKEKIPAATQLFTPDWIVRYMVENSLGRLWLDSHPKSKLRECWKYYVNETEQIPEVTKQLRILQTENPIKSPENIKFIDPCMGSGHILVYAFDVFMQIYLSEGYSERDAAQLILEKNIFGLDIDRRAYQLSYFALMMKARQYNRRILSLRLNPQVYEPTGYPEGMEFGSLVKVEELEPRPEKINEHQTSLFDNDYETKLNIWNFRRILVQEYDVVVTNPPYMGFSNMSNKISNYLKKHYYDGKADLFSAFIIRSSNLAKKSGYYSMITQPSLLTLASFEKLREKIITTNSIYSVLHFGRGIFGIDFGSLSFVVRNSKNLSWFGDYFRLHKRTFQYIESSDIEQLFLTSKDDINCKFDFENYDTNIGLTSQHFEQGDTIHFIANQNLFLKVPGYPISYSFTNRIFEIFSNYDTLSSFGITRLGMTTADNEKFTRLWFEPDFENCIFSAANAEDVRNSGCKWVPYNKGGKFRKWYGNLDTLVNWSNNGDEIKNFADKEGRIRSTVPNSEYYFKECLTWSKISSGSIAFRFRPQGSIFDVAGACLYSDKNYYLLGLLNSKIAMHILSVMSPTMNFEGGHIKSIPIIIKNENRVVEIVKENINYSRIDWNLFETSWDFKRHQLIRGNSLISYEFNNFEKELSERFINLKSNEEELNEIFIDNYDISSEITREVEEDDVTISRANVSREIRSLISFSVGCIFGRYSLDNEGLVYAGGVWDASKYQKFSVDKDNIIPVLDDEYFEDDIVGRFVSFIKTVYGEETLEENLKFIADSLGGKGTSMDIIRNYFLNDFYTDHLKIYQKRPIYWMFDSGKKNGFKALIYMHRYSRDLLAKLRTDYVHEQQERYRTQLSRISSELNHALGNERSKLLKQQDKLTEQLREITAFEEKIHHLADQHIDIDLDDGVKKNYALFEDVLAKI